MSNYYKMFEDRYYYLVYFQYLGYRFHGWQKQPNLKTVHLMIDRTLNYILQKDYFKTLVAGRTDAMVSAEHAAFELFLSKPIEDIETFLEHFNHNLPQDIRIISIEEVDASFNIIQDSKSKEYHYMFAYGDKYHPFCAPILTTILDELDIEIMKLGAKLFEGHHNFRSYCYKPSDNGKYTRTIDYCEIVENTEYTASFFPETSYIFKVRSSGFGRNQIRLMMGTLLELGRGEITCEEIKESLKPGFKGRMAFIAPASGLILKTVEFE